MQALCFSWQHQNDCHHSSLPIFYYRSASCNYLSVLFPTFRHSWNYLLFYPSLVSDHKGSPITHFYREVTRPISWQDEERCFSHLLFYVVFLDGLTCCIHSSLFSDWRRPVSSKFFDALVPSVSTISSLLERTQL